ncbi:MAG: hypothetical protein JSW65_01765, partial [Candidatus Bipolaricaulota bacterium]
WTIPTPGGWPHRAVSALPNVGAAYFAFAERLAGQIALFEMAQAQLPPGPVVAPSATTTLVRHTSLPAAHVVAAASTVHPATGAVPSASYVLPRSTATPFVEWGPIPGGNYIEDVSVHPGGEIWFVDGASQVHRLDHRTNTASDYDVPSGRAVAVDIPGTGDVWYLDSDRAAIGKLDVVTGEVILWEIPGGVQPIDLLVDGMLNVWFVDREADLIGYLEPPESRFVLFDLPTGSFPVRLTRDGQLEHFWFVAERGGIVGRLRVP